MKMLSRSAALALAALLPSIASADPILAGMRIFSTGSKGLTCSSGVKTQTWTNTTGKPINIAKIQIWNGLYRDTTADVQEIVTRISDGAILIDGGHDDYSNGGAVRIQSQDWGGNYFPLGAGDGLLFTYSCLGGVRGGWMVTIWTK